jgi:hypothetical protein
MSGATIGAVRLVLRLEGLCVLIAASVAYSKFGLGWGTFALFFLTPDVSFLGYLAGPKVGAVSYNIRLQLSFAPGSSGALTSASTERSVMGSSIQRAFALLILAA